MNKKWKLSLLKSGLPLEAVVANQLISLGHHVLGEYPYLRPDEKNEIREFSVDIRTFSNVQPTEPSHALSMLVECKYRNPHTTWLFAPVPSDSYAIGLLHDTSDLATVRFHNDALWRFEEKIGYCVGGVEIAPDGTCNRDAVRHGVSQLRFAMPTLVERALKSAYEDLWSEGRHVEFCCPILVTTADIRILRSGVSLAEVEAAESLDEISSQKDALICNEQSGPQLQEYADRIADSFVRGASSLGRRMKALQKVLVGPEWRSRVAPDTSTVVSSFAHSSERVLIVNHAAFPSVLEKLQAALEFHTTLSSEYGRLAKSAESVCLLDPEGAVLAREI
jgi:hypothetical protein